MKAIYSRVSTRNQKHERQLKNRNDYDFIYLDEVSGSVPFNKRPSAIDLMNNDKIDYILINEVTRLGRNLNDILNTLQYFTDKKVNIHIENLGLTTLLPDGKPNPTAKLVINMMGSISEYERELIRERTQQGREIAKTKNVFKGRKRGSKAKISEYKLKYRNDIDKVQKLIKDNNISTISMATNIPRTRIYRFIEKGLVNQ